jgi:hypothetical protein
MRALLLVLAAAALFLLVNHRFEPRERRPF